METAVEKRRKGQSWYFLDKKGPRLVLSPFFYYIFSIVLLESFEHSFITELCLKFRVKILKNVGENRR